MNMNAKSKVPSEGLTYFEVSSIRFFKSCRNWRSNLSRSAWSRVSTRRVVFFHQQLKTPLSVCEAQTSNPPPPPTPSPLPLRALLQSYPSGLRLPIPPPPPGPGSQRGGFYFPREIKTPLV